MNFLTTGKLKVLRDNKVGPRGGKYKEVIPNGGWNIIHFFIKSLKTKNYKVKETEEHIELTW